MTKREEFWQMLTAVTNPRSFKYDGDKFQMSIDIPILPENVHNFKKEILAIFGSPDKFSPEWDDNLIYHSYKFNPNYIPIDGQTLVFNKYGQIAVAEESVTNEVEKRVLDQLGIDVKNDEIHLDSFQGLSTISQQVVSREETRYDQTTDYSDLDNWYLFPQHSAGKLDVFILYPTTVYDPDKPELIETTDIEMNRGVNDFLKVIIPIFKDLPVNLYMPKYRQVNGAFIERYTTEWFAANASKSIEDVYSAFAYFIEQCQSSPRFITFSHDQGTILNYLLATDFMQYLTGITKGRWANVWGLGIGLDDSITRISSLFLPSGLSNDMHTIISWNTATPNETVKRRKTWGNGTSLAVNPLTFTRTYDTQTKENISLISYFNKNLCQIKSSLKAKVIQDPFGNEIVNVIIDENSLLTPDQILEIDNNNQGYFHNFDIGLFVGNIRENMIVRYGL
jgi:hypothetical protein